LRISIPRMMWGVNRCLNDMANLLVSYHIVERVFKLLRNARNEHQLHESAP